MFLNFCVPLSKDYLSNLQEKFQVASTYDTHVEYQTLSFSYNVFWSYVGDRQTQTAKNVTFGFILPQDMEIHQNLAPKQYFLFHTWLKESKNRSFTMEFQ